MNFSISAHACFADGLVPSVDGADYVVGAANYSPDALQCWFVRGRDENEQTLTASFVVQPCSPFLLQCHEWMAAAAENEVFLRVETLGERLVDPTRLGVLLATMHRPPR